MRAWIAAFVITIALLTISRPSFALEPIPPPGNNKVKSGFALMMSGAVVTGVGAFVYVANENSGKTACTPCAQKSAVFPVTLMALGSAIFITGGTLLTIGLVQNSRATTPTATLNLGPFGGSVRVLF